METTLGVFLSHSHEDRRVARRLTRRLASWGAEVWLDERRLRVGSALTATLRAHIEAADVVLVVSSQAAAESEWVRLEVGHARELGRPVVPVFIDAVADREPFRDFVGVDATAPHRFARVVETLTRDLFESFDREPPSPAPEVMAAGLRELAAEEPSLEPMILGCLDGEGLHGELADAVFDSAFHPLDYAVDALMELRGDEATAGLAARAFACAGAGVQALFRWVDSSGDGGLPLVTALAGPLPDAALLDTAIELLAAGAPPNDHALYTFIHHNAQALSPEQRTSVVRLVTWPVRETPDRARLTDVLGWVAATRFPEADPIRDMWRRWIRTGGFDGAPGLLAGYLADAAEEGLPDWSSVDDALRGHVRDLLRSGDEGKVHDALAHVRATADVGAPVLSSLVREAQGVSGTWEWKKWAETDPEAAERARWYVHQIVAAATGDRNWIEAMASAERMIAFERERRRLLGEAGSDPEDDGAGAGGS